MNDFLSMSNSRGVRAAGKAGTGSAWFKFSNLLHLLVTGCRCRCSGERSGNTGNDPYALDFCGGNWSTFCIWLVTSGSSSHLWVRGPMARRLAPEWMTALSHPLLPQDTEDGLQRKPEIQFSSLSICTLQIVCGFELKRRKCDLTACHGVYGKPSAPGKILSRVVCLWSGSWNPVTHPLRHIKSFPSGRILSCHRVYESWVLHFCEIINKERWWESYIPVQRTTSPVLTEEKAARLLNV